MYQQGYKFYFQEKNFFRNFSIEFCLTASMHIKNPKKKKLSPALNKKCAQKV